MPTPEPTQNLNAAVVAVSWLRRLLRTFARIGMPLLPGGIVIGIAKLHPNRLWDDLSTLLGVFLLGFGFAISTSKLRKDARLHRDIAKAVAMTPKEEYLDRAYLHRSIGAWLLIIGLLVYGTQLVVWSTYFHGTVEFLLAHFGVAMLVGGIAGIGFEMFAHYKHLHEEIVELHRLNDRVAELQLSAVLGRMIPADHSLMSDIAATIRSIAKIQAEPVKASEVSVRFVHRLQRYARDAAVALEKVRTEGDKHILELPRNAASLADEILAAHALRMEDGDTYDVLSDFSTWKNEQLPRFSDALERVIVTKKVAIRRIFCFFPHDAELSKEDVLAILRSHWCLAERTYRSNTTTRNNTVKGCYNVAVTLGRAGSHVGVFRQGDEFTCFKPIGDGDLSMLTVSRSDDLAEFERHWLSAVRAFDVHPETRALSNLLSFVGLEARILDRDGKFFDKFDVPRPREWRSYPDCECLRALKNASPFSASSAGDCRRCPVGGGP